MSSPGPHPLGLTLAAFAEAYPQLRGGARAAYQTLFRTGNVQVAGLDVHIPEIARTLRSDSPEGEVIKFVQRVNGARSPADRAPALATLTTLETESVLIPVVGRKGSLSYSLCVSSQVGCAMGCGFCETAQMGLIRSLEPWEIVAQWFAATHTFKQRPRNLVFMGMGEPMDNLAAVLAAIEVLVDPCGGAMASSRIMISTVGRVDGIRALAERVRTPGWHRLGLAVSVNAPNDEIRSRIMPVNRAVPMAELRRALEEWPIFGQAKICLEYVLIPGVNDADDHARELAAWARGLPACVQVIPYNPRRDSPWPAPSEDGVERFRAIVNDQGVPCLRRRTKGRDMMGACGQLGNESIRKRRVVSPASTQS